MKKIKDYKESEVIDKAMSLFWQNNFEPQFSAILKKEKSTRLPSKNVKNSLVPIENEKDLMQYFLRLFELTKHDSNKMNLEGQLENNTKNNEMIRNENQLERFNDVKVLFFNRLQKESIKSEAIINIQANYLTLALVGCVTVVPFFDKIQLNQYVKKVFNNLQ
tara:strand:- start:8421 stop:8909 length:489 start_codon:yes stop_codon:yes gene_type:complete